MTTITLSKAVEFNGQSVEEITIREPLARDLYRLDFTQPLEAMATLLVNLSEQPPELIDMLPGRDFLRCTQEIERFLGQPLTVT